MKGSKENYIGKRATWNDLVRLFPDRWIAMSDCTKDRADIVDGVVEGILTDSEVEQGVGKFVKKFEVLDRTSLGDYGGYVDVRVVEDTDDKY
jgi:hypothetical protein